MANTVAHFWFQRIDDWGQVAMKLFFSSFYAIGKIALGLLLHPYQTMQPMMQEKIFIWMTLFPMVSLALVIFLWRIVVVPTVHLFFSCHSGIGGMWFESICFGLPFLANWMIFFCIYWQLLLCYLLVRFWRAIG